MTPASGCCSTPASSNTRKLQRNTGIGAEHLVLDQAVESDNTLHLAVVRALGTGPD